MPEYKIFGNLTFWIWCVKIAYEQSLSETCILLASIINNKIPVFTVQLKYIPILILTCHFLTIEHILSRVRSMPWKFVRQFFPWTSSVISLNLRKATSSFCRSARLTSNTRPFSPSEAISINIKQLTCSLKTPLSYISLSKMYFKWSSAFKIITIATYNCMFNSKPPRIAL